MQDPATVKMMAEMVDDGPGLGYSAWFTRALAVQKQHQTPPEIDFTPPVIGPQWIIIGKYIAGGGLDNVFARSTQSIKSPTKRPRSEKPGAASNNYCLFGRQTRRMSPPKLQSYRQEYAVLARA